MQSIILPRSQFLALEYVPPTWKFTEGGNIYQSVNCAAGVAVGDLWFTDVEYEGTVAVIQNYDYDFMGVVFAFQVLLN